MSDKKMFSKEDIINLSAKLKLGINWEDNKKQLYSLLDEFAPFAEIAVCWNQPGDYVFFTNESENIFRQYFEKIKRGDMVQSKELISFDNELFADTYVISVTLGHSYLGMLLIKVNEDIELSLLNELAQTILPQLSLAKYATTMSDEVEKRTSTDKLTGLWNRNYFNERFREECSRVSRTKEQGSLAIIALDELAAMSKVMSSEENKKLISEASSLIRGMVRNTDWVVYWDTHQVLFYLTNTQAETAIEVISRCVSKLVEKHELLQPIIGMCNTSETASARALIQLASRRLELSRKDGRKMVGCFATREGLKFLQFPLEKKSK